MTMPTDEYWLDGDAGRLVRPYAVTNGRTAATRQLSLTSMVLATGAGLNGTLEPDHLHALALCHQPVSVAEIAAHLQLPAAIAKVLLSDLVDFGALRTAPQSASDTTNRVLLERLLDDLQRRI